MRRSPQSSTRALIALAPIAGALLALALSGTSTAAAQSTAIRRGLNANTPRLVVTGYSPAAPRNGAAASSVVAALQRRVDIATLWVIPKSDTDRFWATDRWDTTAVADPRNLRQLGRLLRARHVLDVQATTRASEVQLTGTLYRSGGDTLPILVLTVSGTSLDVAADSLASRVLGEPDILKLAPSDPMRRDESAQRRPPPSR